MIPQCLSGDFYRDTFFDNGIPSGVFTLGNIGVALIGPNTTAPMANLSWQDYYTSAMAGGALRALGITSKRAAFGVPSLSEQGLNVVLANWRGVFALATK